MNGIKIALSNIFNKIKILIILCIAENERLWTLAKTNLLGNRVKQQPAKKQ